MNTYFPYTTISKMSDTLRLLETCNQYSNAIKEEQINQIAKNCIEISNESTYYLNEVKFKIRNKTFTEADINIYKICIQLLGTLKNTLFKFQNCDEKILHILSQIFFEAHKQMDELDQPMTPDYSNPLDVKQEKKRPSEPLEPDALPVAKKHKFVIEETIDFEKFPNDIILLILKALGISSLLLHATSHRYKNLFSPDPFKKTLFGYNICKQLLAKTYTKNIDLKKYKELAKVFIQALIDRNLILGQSSINLFPVKKLFRFVSLPLRDLFEMLYNLDKKISFDSLEMNFGLTKKDNELIVNPNLFLKTEEWPIFLNILSKTIPYESGEKITKQILDNIVQTLDCLSDPNGDNDDEFIELTALYKIIAASFFPSLINSNDDLNYYIKKAYEGNHLNQWFHKCQQDHEPFTPEIRLKVINLIASSDQAFPIAFDEKVKDFERYDELDLNFLESDILQKMLDLQPEKLKITSYVDDQNASLKFAFLLDNYQKYIAKNGINKNSVIELQQEIRNFINVINFLRDPSHKLMNSKYGSVIQIYLNDELADSFKMKTLDTIQKIIETPMQEETSEIDLCALLRLIQVFLEKHPENFGDIEHVFPFIARLSLKFQDNQDNLVKLIMQFLSSIDPKIAVEIIHTYLREENTSMWNGNKKSKYDLFCKNHICEIAAYDLEKGFEIALAIGDPRLRLESIYSILNFNKVSFDFENFNNQTMYHNIIMCAILEPEHLNQEKSLLRLQTLINEIPIAFEQAQTLTFKQTQDIYFLFEKFKSLFPYINVNPTIAMGLLESFKKIADSIPVEITECVKNTMDVNMKVDILAWIARECLDLQK